MPLILRASCSVIKYMSTNVSTFPGVYTTITDNSFTTPATSAFAPGLIGVASQGPFNTPTQVTSLAQYVQLFGQPIPQSEETTPFFMSDAVALLAPLTNGITVVRVGNMYNEMPVQEDVVSTFGTYFTAGTANVNFIQSMLNSGEDVYVAISEAGYASTVNVEVAYTSGTNVFLVAGETLNAQYPLGATVAYSNSEGAAWTAESVLYAYSYGTAALDFTDRPLTAVGSVSGLKGAYTFAVSGTATGIVVGGLYKISDGTNPDTDEVMVKQIVNNTVYLQTSNVTKIGYQALPLQANYATASLYPVNEDNKVPFLYLTSSSAGSWANGTSNQTGLFVAVAPGSAPGSKKLLVYLNSQQVETLDNIDAAASASDPNSYESIIANSAYIAVAFRDNTVTRPSVITSFVAANTVNPWDASYWVFYNPAGGPLSMPQGAINNGVMGGAVDNENTGGQFDNGFNGQNPADTDIIGSYDPATGNGTGIKAFEQLTSINVNVLACPMDDIPIDVMQELTRVATEIDAIALADVPSTLNAQAAIDWSNGQGQFEGNGRIDSPNLAIFWNWWQTTNPFTGAVYFVPPTLGALRAMAYTYNNFGPWYAAAGQTRGLIPEALSVAFPSIPPATEQAMYGNGQSVNPIITFLGAIMVWGDRTMQIANSKLSQIHAVSCVNYIATGLSALARQFVFDPNDPELYSEITLTFTDFLDKIVNGQGLTSYNLVCDSSNNTPATINMHQVIVSLSIIPTDVAETIFINITVDSTGATLTSVT